MIRFLMYLLVLTISSMLLIGTAIGGLYFIYGFMACAIFLVSVIVFLFGIVWMLDDDYSIYQNLGENKEGELQDDK